MTSFCGSLPHKSLFLTQVRSDVRNCDKVMIEIRPMTPAEAMHPCALWTGSDG